MPPWGTWWIEWDQRPTQYQAPPSSPQVADVSGDAAIHGDSQSGHSSLLRGGVSPSACGSEAGCSRPATSELYGIRWPDQSAATLVTFVHTGPLRPDRRASATRRIVAIDNRRTTSWCVRNSLTRSRTGMGEKLNNKVGAARVTWALTCAATRSASSPLKPRALADRLSR
jgi:hypothetical protein